MAGSSMKPSPTGTDRLGKDDGMKKGGKVKKNWIADAIKKPGALKKELGVAKDKKIPSSKLAAATKKPGVEGKRARLAETLKGFKK